MLAHQLKDAISRYWIKKRFAVNFEMGLCRGGRLRADVLAIAMTGKLVIVETKSSTADYKSDKKWQKYLAFADSFYLAFDRPTYEKLKPELPKGIGVFVVDEVPNRTGTKMLLKAVVVKKAKTQEVAEEVRRELLIRMVFRNADLNRYK
jgi:hypothetical protein